MGNPVGTVICSMGSPTVCPTGTHRVYNAFHGKAWEVQDGAWVAWGRALEDDTPGYLIEKVPIIWNFNIHSRICKP